MKAAFFLFLLPVWLCGQGDAVATVNGRKLTAEELERALAGAPPEVRKNFGTQRKAFLEQYALMLRLVELAEQNGIHEKSPHKERLEWVRMQILMQGQLQEASDGIQVSPEEQKKFFEANKDRYTQAQVKVIYIPFGTPSQGSSAVDKKVLTEAEAKARVDGLKQQIQGGADFVKLVKEHSQDSESAAKDGDFPPIKRSDSIPDNIKNAVFALKPGEVSEPVRQPNGFYLFRLEKMVVQTLEELGVQIQNEVRQARFQEWFESVRKGLQVKIENEAYFNQ